MIKGIRDENHNTKYIVNDKFKRIYILIKESIKINLITDNIDTDFDFNEVGENKKVEEIKVVETVAEIKAVETVKTVAVKNNCYCNEWFKCSTCVSYAYDHGTIQ